MNTVPLSPKWIEDLLQLPETGMGYQLVKNFLKNDKVLHKRKVINGSLLVLPPDEIISKDEIVKIEVEFN